MRLEHWLASRNQALLNQASAWSHCMWPWTWNWFSSKRRDSANWFGHSIPWQQRVANALAAKPSGRVAGGHSFIIEAEDRHRLRIGKVNDPNFSMPNFPEFKERNEFPVPSSSNSGRATSSTTSRAASGTARRLHAPKSGSPDMSHRRRNRS